MPCPAGGTRLRVEARLTSIRPGFFCARLLRDMRSRVFSLLPHMIALNREAENFRRALGT